MIAGKAELVGSEDDGTDDGSAERCEKAAADTLAEQKIAAERHEDRRDVAEKARIGDRREVNGPGIARDIDGKDEPADRENETVAPPGEDFAGRRARLPSALEAKPEHENRQRQDLAVKGGRRGQQLR